MAIDLREEQKLPGAALINPVEVLDATPRRSAERSRRDHRRLSASLIALSAAGCMAFSSAAPAGIAVMDAFYRAAFGGIVVWAASRSRRWTWALLAGISVVVASSLITQVAAFVAVLIAAASLRQNRRRYLAGTIVAFLSMPALLTQGEGPLWRLSNGEVEDFFGLSALITVAATAPVIRSGWRTLSRRKRRQIRLRSRRFGYVVIAILVISLSICAVAVPSMVRGLREMRTATEAAQAGDLDEAATQFSEAADTWEGANRIVAGPWMIPARMVPVLGQHVRSAQVVSGQASALSESAAVATSRVEPDALILDGAVNLDEVDRITPAVDAFAATVDRAATRISQTQSPWLVPPVGNRIDRAMEILVPASGVLNASAEGLHVGANLLGHNEPANILIMLSTPAEARGAGGFVGNWALVRADEGRLEVVEQYRTRQLNALLEDNDAILRADADYTARYGRFNIERHIQDVTVSPDFPSVAPVAADLFEQATGHSINAVIAIDPFAIQKLVQFSGPLPRSGSEPLTGKNAADELLTEQYNDFGDDEVRREQELSALTTQLVAALLDSPPDPIAFATELAPLADQDRVSLWLASDFDGSIADRVGLSGGFPDTTGDLFALVHQNSGQNKIDTFLERAVEISTTIDPKAETVAHEVTITLDNGAPTSGLPDAVLKSNDQGLEPGTNRMLLSLYSALPVTSARLDGDELALQAELEFGRSVYSTVIAIPSGEFVTLEIELAGQIDLSSNYSMTFGSQPTVHPDQMSWKIRTTDGSKIDAPDGWLPNSFGIGWSSPLDRDKTFDFGLG